MTNCPRTPAAATRPAAPPPEQALDPLRLRQALQQAMRQAGGADLHITDLRITQLRRNTSRLRNPHPYTLCCEADLQPVPGGPVETRRFHAKACRDGASARLAQDQGGLHLPALDLVAWAWPADPGLPQLPALLDPDQTRRWTGQRASAVQALRHEPGCRATLRYTVAQPGQPAQTLFAKTFDDDRGAAIHQRFVHFWQQACRDSAAPTVAQPLGYDPATRSLWQAAASGQPLMAVLTRGEARPGLPAAVARAWAAVHQAPLALAGGAPRDRRHWLAEVARRCKKVARAQPALADAAARLADTLADASARWPEPPATLIHGDCHPDQLWLQGDRVVLFDFDEFQPGDPMEDLAAFTTRLQMAGVPAAWSQALLATYALAAPGLWHAPRLRWHQAVQQLLQAARAYGFQRPGWPAEMGLRLHQAQRLAEACLQATDEPAVMTP